MSREQLMNMILKQSVTPTLTRRPKIKTRSPKHRR